MAMLNDEQRLRALEVMRQYLVAPVNPDGSCTPVDRQAGRDIKRVEVIEKLLKPLVSGFLGGTIPLERFKSDVDSLNKQHEYWGFKGIKGQMFFNVLFNRSEDLADLTEELKAAIAVPANEDMARSRIKTFASYAKRVGNSHLDGGGSKHARPKVGSVPFFLSYFWQVQDRRTWPVYYTNSVNTMIDLNLWTPSEDLADDYIAYKRIHEELAALFSQARGRSFGLYEVEHVFWFKGGNPFGGNKPAKDAGSSTTEVIPGLVAEEGSLLPESYVPPIVAVLSRMAVNEAKLAEAAKTSGTSIERAFEKSVNAAFTILSYDTKLMGQGNGRVPDGLALDLDSSYAIIWDAKVRAAGYSMGMDDRTIHEYIVSQSRDLRRRRALRNIYYLIVSSIFADDWDDAVRSLKMETDISEVCLTEASALVAMVDAKLRNPHQITLGPDGMQRLFSTSGVISAGLVQKMLS
jgi:hypothetical protein